ncbi:MAG: hypothetical protein MZV63_48350 [Marinilabiliales bacterium]|nr:hypothetical protein [Marinilabiliales bacterium]
MTSSTLSRRRSMPSLPRSIMTLKTAELKRVERNLWENIRHKTEEGRRTGIGITAEGDMLAALGLRYGTDEATEFSVEVHRTLAIEAYRSSTELAKERGAVPDLRAVREKVTILSSAASARLILRCMLRWRNTADATLPC